MIWKQIDHRDGSKSIHLIPESRDEMTQLHRCLSTWPGGCRHDYENTKAIIDFPVLTKDGYEWPDDTAVKQEMFTRRIYLGHKEG